MQVAARQPSIAGKERIEFSQRLRDSMGNIGCSDSPTVLAREFNVRFDGVAVTVHAARKWMTAESIPTQEKLSLIANWLRVSPEWLRFGGMKLPTELKNEANFLNLNSEEIVLICNIRKLSGYNKRILRELTSSMANTA